MQGDRHGIFGSKARHRWHASVTLLVLLLISNSLSGTHPVASNDTFASTTPRQKDTPSSLLWRTIFAFLLLLHDLFDLVDAQFAFTSPAALPTLHGGAKGLIHMERALIELF